MLNATLLSRAREEGAFTIIEVLMATLVLTVGVIALVGTFNPARDLGSLAEQRQAASARAEAEINYLASLPFSSIALKATPTVETGATATNPSYYISSGPCSGSGPTSSPCYQWDWNSSSSKEPLDIEPATTDSAANPTAWTTTFSTSNATTRFSGEVYRYVTWVNDSNCTASACGGATDDKRITVAVTIEKMRVPVELSTVVTNPVGGAYDPLDQSGIACSNGGVTVACIG